MDGKTYEMVFLKGGQLMFDPASIKKWWNNANNSEPSDGRAETSESEFVFTEGGGFPLTDFSEGFTGTIADIRAEPSHRRQLMLLGALPGNRVSVEQDKPAYVVKIEDMRFALDAELAGRIYVKANDSV